MATASYEEFPRLPGPSGASQPLAAGYRPTLAWLDAVAAMGRVIRIHIVDVGSAAAICCGRLQAGRERVVRALLCN